MSTKQKDRGRTIKATAATSRAVDEGNDDLEVLNPNREITIAGIKVTIREYGFVEGLGVRARSSNFLNDLLAALSSTHQVVLEEIVTLIEHHSETLLPEIALAANVDMEFIERISEREGETLILAWWVVNGPFFLARAVRMNRAALSKAATVTARAGQTSTPNSSPVDTAQSESLTTPSDK
jgi:hypothetical protein